jgi:hypothetical protein
MRTFIVNDLRIDTSSSSSLMLCYLNHQNQDLLKSCFHETRIFGRTTHFVSDMILVGRQKLKLFKSSDTKFVFRVNAFKICLHEQCFSVSDATAASKDRNNPIFCTVSDAAVASDTEKHCSCKQTFVLS